MRAVYKYLIFISISVIAVTLIVFVIKGNIAHNLVEKKNSIDSTWEKIVEINDSKVDYLKKNLYPLEKDTLLNIIEFDKNKKESNDDYTFFLYELNNYLINAKIDLKTKMYFAKIDSINNQLIKKYNEEVMDFNKYASSFPIIIVARSRKYKTYDKLPIIFGQPNKDPKQTKREALDWLKDIEEKKGL